MDWLIADAEFYVIHFAGLVVYVLAVAAIVAIVERVLASYGIRHQPRPAASHPHPHAPHGAHPAH